MSGANLYSGRSALASGWSAVDEFAIGCEVEPTTATAFQLAPRSFVVARQAGSEAANDQASGGPLAHLPSRLHFLEGPSSGPLMQQRWVSEVDSAWKWELEIRYDHEAVEAMLTASQPSNGKASQFVWKSYAPWNSFGSNQLEPAHLGDDAAPLTVAAV